MWLLFAFASSIFAALTSILAKIGIEGVNSNLATALRTMVVVIMAWEWYFLQTHREELQAYRKRAGFSLSCQALPPASPGSVITGHYRLGSIKGGPY